LPSITQVPPMQVPHPDQAAVVPGSVVPSSLLQGGAGGAVAPPPPSAPTGRNGGRP